MRLEGECEILGKKLLLIMRYNVPAFCLAAFQTNQLLA